MRAARRASALFVSVLLVGAMPSDATARKMVTHRLKHERIVSVGRGDLRWMAGNRDRVCWLWLGLHVECYDKAMRKRFSAEHGNWPSNSVLAMDEAAMFWDDSNQLHALPTDAARPADYRTPRQSVSLYTFRKGHILTGITLDAESVYIMEEGSTNNLLRVPRKGGESMSLVQARSIGVGHHLVNDSTHVYWLGQIDPYIRRVPKAGGPSEEFFRVGSPRALAVDDKEVCYVSAQPPVVACIDKVTRTRRIVTELKTYNPTLSALVLDGDMVYFANEGRVPYEDYPGRGMMDPTIRVRDGAIYKVPRAGGKPVVVAKGLDEPIDLHVDATDVYWMSRRAGGIWRIPK